MQSLQDRKVYLLCTCPITRARLGTRSTIAWVDRTDVGHYDAWAVLSGQRHSAYASKTGRSQKCSSSSTEGGTALVASREMKKVASRQKYKKKER